MPTEELVLWSITTLAVMVDLRERGNKIEAHKDGTLLIQVQFRQ